MRTVYVNDKPVEIGDEERLNLVQAAQRAGVLIPHYCWHPALSVVASCRMCLVEVGQRMEDGSNKMMPKVMPACQTPAKAGTVVITTSEKAKDAQAQTLEGLLVNHPLDCPVCDKAGECTLQDFSYKFGHAESRVVDEKRRPPNKPELGPTITLFTDRCIMCSRCVRFTREISGTSELQVIRRGDHSEIDVFPGQPLDNKLAGNVVDLCPVGALGDKDFLYKQRVWYLKTHSSVCPGCSTGCSIHLDVNKDIVYRLRPRPNPDAQGYFMCDEGRYGYHYVNSSERITRPMIRDGEDPQRRRWKALFEGLRNDLNNAVEDNPSAVVAVLSPMLTCEEAYLLANYFKSLSPDVVLALGYVPIVGEDDTYPKNWRGDPIEPVKFTIRAEKVPNRLGVEAVLKHFQGEVISFADVIGKANNQEIKALYLTAGYPSADWVEQAGTEALSSVPLLIVQDLFHTSLSNAAKYLLPGTTFAEKTGLLINHAGLVQEITRGIRPPEEARTEGQVALDLMNRHGLIHAPTIRHEMGSEIEALRDLTVDKYPANGIRIPLK